jgi:CheY-like chemotaxis protein
VLLVEDDVGIRSVLAACLREEGYEVAEATNGREGLAHLQHWRPDVVVLDLMMPVLDGWGFLAQRRVLPSLAAIPVVVMSAALALREPLQQLGAAAILPKPFDLDLFCATVLGLVEGAQLPAASERDAGSLSPPHGARVLAYLGSVAPAGATNAQIRQAAGLGSRQMTFVITRDLLRRHLVRAEQPDRRWVFYALETAAS